jgi:hypothetical protein
MYATLSPIIVVYNVLTSTFFTIAIDELVVELGVFGYLTFSRKLQWGFSKPNYLFF